MSTWISDKHRILMLVAAIAAAGLSACTSSRMGDGLSGAAPFASRTTIKVASGEVVIEGPKGFCVDNASSKTSGDAAFVVLGNCRVVSPETRAREPEVKALLTASVTPAAQDAKTVAGSQASMDRFFRSEAGRRALSRDSDPSTVRILDSFQRDDAYFLRAADTSNAIVPGASDEYWRSYFDLDGQIVSVSVIGFRSDPLPPEKSLLTVREFTRLIRARNGRAAGSVPPAATTPTAATSATQTAGTETATDGDKSARKFWRLGILRML
ncbi:MAG: hypothetical protein ACE5DK_10325, partial [Paracoccaceae bacterium]